MKKPDNPISDSIEDAVLYWTGRNPELTRYFVKLVKKNNYGGYKNPSILIQELIAYLTKDGFKNIDKIEPLKKIQNRWLNNNNCEPFWLLTVYQQILEQQKIIIDLSPAQKELLAIGLVVKENGYLKISNLIYQYFFNQNWIKKQLKQISPYQLTLKKLAVISDRPHTVIEEILSWTNRDFLLTQELCYLIYKNLDFIPASKEKELVEYIVRSVFIENWHLGKIGQKIERIRDCLVQTEKGSPTLLKLYRTILEYPKITANYNKQQMQLLQIGLLDVEEGYLIVYNRIYREIFTLDWVNKEIQKIENSLDLNQIVHNPQNQPEQKSFMKNFGKILVINLIILLGFATVFELLNLLFPHQEKVAENSKELPQKQSKKSPQNQIAAEVSKSLIVNKTNFNEVEKIPVGIFRYGGSTTWAPIRGKVDPIIAISLSNFKLVYTEHPIIAAGSGTGIKMLLDSQISFSQSSRPLKPKEYEQAAQINIRLKEIPVAIDAIVFAVNPQLNIPGLTLLEIKDIYTGKITNWREVGGPDLEIRAYSKSPKESGTAEFFQKNLLSKEKFSDRVEIVTNLTTTLRKVGRDKGAIFYASAPEIIGQCSIKPLPIGRRKTELIKPYQAPLITPSQCPAKRNTINYEVFQNAKYPLTRYLFVIIKQNGLFEEEAGLAYAKLLLTQEGQKLIEGAGFVPIHK